MILARGKTSRNGKWHVQEDRSDEQAACGAELGVAVDLRDSDLLMASEKCRHDRCLRARLRASGVSV